MKALVIFSVLSTAVNYFFYSNNCKLYLFWFSITNFPVPPEYFARSPTHIHWAGVILNIALDEIKDKPHLDNYYLYAT